MGGTSTNAGVPSRRRVLQAGLGWLTAASLAEATRTGDGCPAAGRTLVLLHLSGGNDALNTVVPYRDPLYYELRPRLSRAARRVLPIGAHLGFHRSLAGLALLFRRGHLAVVQGVGYAGPDYSHVGSCRIWATGSKDKDLNRNWWIPVVYRLPDRPGAVSILAGDSVTAVERDTDSSEISSGGDAVSALGVSTSPIPYTPGQMQQVLATILRLVNSARPPALIFAAAGGFDTHEEQLEAHECVLRELGDGLAAFQRGLEERGDAERVLLMAWSEFGRRPAENAMGGTDHGSAGTVFLLGRRIRGGLYGRMPSLRDMEFGNLVSTVDFRGLYATMARRWFNCPVRGVDTVQEAKPSFPWSALGPYRLGCPQAAP